MPLYLNSVSEVIIPSNVQPYLDNVSEDGIPSNVQPYPESVSEDIIPSNVQHYGQCFRRYHTIKCTTLPGEWFRRFQST